MPGKSKRAEWGPPIGAEQSDLQELAAPGCLDCIIICGELIPLGGALFLVAIGFRLRLLA